MFSHLLKLMWNKRRANGMIFLEILLAFVVLFGVYAFLAYNLNRYSSPLGFTYENSVGVRLDLPDTLDTDSLAALEFQDMIRRDLLAMDAVEAASWIGPVNPFGGSTWNTNTVDDNGRTLRTQMMFVDEYYAETAELTLIDGTWFTEDNMRAKYRPLVVNKKFHEDNFPDVSSIVDTIVELGGEHIIVGVTSDYKYKGNFADNVPLSFYPQADRLEDEDPFEMMILRLRPGSLADNEEAIYNLLVQHTKNTDVVIWDMAKDRRKANRSVLIPMVILIVISGFLLINIALGLFGVLFTQINRRRAEIGLRKAMGATPGQVTLQFVMEVVLVTGAALFLGSFFAVQVPFLELLPIPSRFFYYAILGAILTILFIVILCAIVPSRQAAGLQPANVLHED
ncbi:MAG: FtsX-like permease family protein [Bacteroidota bacterium]